MSDIAERLRTWAEDDVRAIAKDMPIMGISVDTDDVRRWGALMDEAAARIEELEAALIEKLAPDDVHTNMPGGVMIRQRYSAKKWKLVRRELPANGVEYTLERREQPVT
jgi:hypothetical protein